MIKTKSFTLIELLIVIVIIGILAVALVPRLKGVQGQARDKKRLADLKQVQNALEMYAHDNNGKYPTTNYGRRGICPVFNSGSVNTTTGLSGYIPGLAPNYISELPVDPKPVSNGGCYLYRSDGTDYMFLIYQTVEGKLIDDFRRPNYPNERNFAAYTPGAKLW